MNKLNINININARKHIQTCLVNKRILKNNTKVLFVNNNNCNLFKRNYFTVNRILFDSNENSNFSSNNNDKDVVISTKYILRKAREKSSDAYVPSSLSSFTTGTYNGSSVSIEDQINSNKEREFKKDNRSDILFLSITLLLSLYISISEEKMIKLYHSNEEFQVNLNELFNWFKELDEKGDYDLLVKELQNLKSGNGERLIKLQTTLINTNIGHAQPETTENIERIMSLYASLGQTKQFHTHDLLLVPFEFLLNEMIYDSNSKNHLIPIISKYAQNESISDRPRMEFINILLHLARDPQYRETLADNNAVSLFKWILDKDLARGAPYKYYYAINDIVSSVNPSLLNNIDDRERNFISRCAKEPYLCTRRWYGHTMAWLTSALVTTIGVGASTAAVPVLLGYSMVFGLVNGFQRFTEVGHYPMKADSKPMRVVQKSSFVFLPAVLTLIFARKFTYLLKPLLGYFLGGILVQSELKWISPYTFKSKNNSNNNSSSSFSNY